MLLERWSRAHPGEPPAEGVLNLPPARRVALSLGLAACPERS